VAYRLLADATVAFHLAFILFVVLGGLVVLRRPLVAWLHVPAVVWVVWLELTGAICPLTPLENALRTRAGEEGYAGGFVDHYLMPVIYPAGLTAHIQWGLAIAVLAVNAIVYTRAWRIARRKGRKP
jgi:hypothetical protein